MGLFDSLLKKPENKYFDEGKKIFNDCLKSDKLRDVFDIAFAKSFTAGPNDKFAFSDAIYNATKGWLSLAVYTEALEFFDKAIAIKPDYAEAWFYRGRILLKLRQGKDAPDNLEMIRNGKKVIFIKRDWDTEALGSFDKAIAIKPDYAEAWFYRGGTLGNLGLFSEACVSFDNAITLKSDYTDAFYYLGLALSTLGRNAEAVASFDKALAIDPNNAETKQNRELALKKLT
jgi:tetratricopeptide (TPR) repeat protein